jgi:hypothetical protein
MLNLLPLAFVLHLVAPAGNALTLTPAIAPPDSIQSSTPAIAPADEPLAPGAAPVIARAARPSSRSSSSTMDAGIPPAWSYGLSFPVTRFGFSRNPDGSFGGNLTPVQAAVGTSVFYNAVRGPGGSVPVGLGALLFGATDLSSKVSDSGLGVAFGPAFWNNTFGVLVGVDLYRRIGSQDTGLLMASAGGRNGLSRENLYVLFNFGIGLGKDAPGALKIAP